MREPFGVLLRRLRERAGLTQEELAERAGISPNAISSLERGIRRPYRHTRDALAAALGVTEAERAEWDAGLPRRGAGDVSRLPAPVSALLGRAGEVERVTRLLGDRRVVTLTGPGGVGKTRLALEVVTRCASRLPDGAVFVALAGTREPGDVLPAIARELGLRELGPREVSEVLASHLRRCPEVLVVLDNMEHLLNAAPDIVGLLASASGLRVLVTSRAPLRIGGEQVHPVTPLAPTDAAELFAERAEQATGAPLRADPAQVARLCTRLDHLPLAIELVAAATRILSPAALIAQSDQFVGSLRGPREARAHQQTLRETVGWSYDLLGPGEQMLLRRAATFVGGWTLDAAAVLTDTPPDDTLQQHLTLLDHSLITRADDPEPRFAILETVRAYAIDQLATAGDVGLAHDQHARLFTTLAADTAPKLWSADCAEALDELDTEHGNIRAALRHLLHAGRHDELAAACYDLWLFWVIRGHLREPHTLVTTALTEPSLRDETRARLHLVAGATMMPRGQHDCAATHFEMATRYATDPGTRHWALVWGAFAEVYRNRPHAAAQLLAATGDLPELSNHADSCAVVGQAHVAIAAGSMREADVLLTARLPEITARQAPWPVAVASGVHGRVIAVLGDATRADGLLSRAVRIFGELGDTWGMAHQLIHIADVAARRADHTRAALLYGAVDALAENVGTHVFRVWQNLSDQHQATTLAALGIDRYTTLRQHGRNMPPSDILNTATPPHQQRDPSAAHRPATTSTTSSPPHPPRLPPD